VKRERMTGKIALLTGAGSGIGRAVAIALAEEGAAVVVTSRTEAEVNETCALVEEAAGRRPLGFVLDLRDRASIEQGIRTVAERFGRIDVLSNNAGIDDPDEPPVVETSDQVWEETFAVNVSGVFQLCRAAIPVLVDGGSIVTIGSTNSLVPRPNAAAYCASKAALLMLTRTLALELAPRRIRANCVCPGVVDTPLTELFLQRADDPAALREEYAKWAPLHRLADPREIASCVVFLASDEASFVTGSALVADGGALAC
jgi:meso-butanediol dehydrogenase / (S,S)-butanediol dehydrogenase / diacetyl reductase